MEDPVHHEATGDENSGRVDPEGRRRFSCEFSIKVSRCVRRTAVPAAISVGRNVANVTTLGIERQQ